MRISSGVAAASLEVEGVGVGGAVATESITDSSGGSVFFIEQKKVTVFETTSNYLSGVNIRDNLGYRSVYFVL